MKNSFIKSVFVVLFVVALFFSCEKPEPITYSLRLGKNIEIVSPKDLDINKIEEKTKITLKVNISENQELDKFLVDGEEVALDNNNQYEFTILKDTVISASFFYSLTFDDNISVVSPSGLNLSRISENTEILLKIDIKDSCEAFEDLYDNTTPLNIDEVNYKLESGDIFAEKKLTMDKSYNLIVKYSENLKIPPVTKYETVSDGIQLNSGDYSGDILIPNFVTSIEDFAFYECDLLNSINIPDSVRNIGLWAFGLCRILEEIYIPLSVENIGAFAFSESSNLKIKCEASSKPAGWDENWNPDGLPVQWGVSE